MYYCKKHGKVVNKRKAYKVCLISRKNWKSGKETYCQSLITITKEQANGRK